MAKHKLIWWLFIVVVVVAALAVESTIRGRAERKRQAFYQSILHQYSTTLRPGTQRGEVEAVLASQGRAFQQSCCLLRNDHVLEDIVKIGSEPKPWYCSENDMYLVFEFEYPAGPVVRETYASDRLRRVELAPWAGGCL